MAEIKAGAVVQLKSGGPQMTVNFVEDQDGTLVAACSWFVNNKRESDRFPVATLVVVPELK
jgi:uncharacterized protein YodC (DUF2158 family)